MKTKIFVTTGSVLEFDSLIREIDNINKNKDHDIICQIGIGSYIPKNERHYRFKKSLEKDYSWADIIITHTGAGTLFELLEKNKKVICISNPKAIDNHELAEKFVKEKYLYFLSGKELFKLKDLLQRLQHEKEIKKYSIRKNTIGKEIIRFIKN